MDELIGLLVDAAAASRRASADTKPAVGQVAPQPQAPPKNVTQKSDGHTTGARAPAKPGSSSVQIEHHAAHPVGLAAAFHDRASLLKALVAVEVLGPPRSLRPREHL